MKRKPRSIAMKKYLAIYIGTADARERSRWDTLDAQTRQAREAEGMRAWQQWGIDNAAAILEHGAPLGKTKRASRAGIGDIRNTMVGYVIVQAESHEAAAKLFANHPHFSVFPGDSVEIMECLPLPGQ
jgi:hypothetical protein